jgi:hypothetical protein
MALQGLATPKFIRRTQLHQNEYRKNFRQIDCSVIEVITSAEAAGVTGLMSKIYLRLVNAPAHLFEKEGVLHFVSEVREGKTITAWENLCETVGVAGGTASKALQWMHEQGVIGYYAAKNGVGIRVFLNRAAASIGTRQPVAATGQGSGKVVAFPPAARHEPPASPLAAGFKDMDLEKPESEYYSPASNHSAQQPDTVKKTTPGGAKDEFKPLSSYSKPEAVHDQSLLLETLETKLDFLIQKCESRLKQETRMVIAESLTREQQRTREWFEQRALPKAIRVAQHESYQVWRRQNETHGEAQRLQAALQIGRFPDSSGGNETPETEARQTARQRILAHLQCLQEKLSGARQAQGWTPKAEAICRQIIADFTEWSGQLTNATTELNMEEFERRLARREEDLSIAQWEGLSEQERCFERQEAERILSSYAARMDAEVYTESLRRLSLKNLRRRYSIPEFALYAL